MLEMSYDLHQKNATRLVCTRCQKPFDVTHGEHITAYVCVSCSGVITLRPRSVLDVNGVLMTDP